MNFGLYDVVTIVLGCIESDILCSIFCAWDSQSKRKVREPKEEVVTLGPAVREGEHVFGVAHIFASFNDTFIVSSLLGVILPPCSIIGFLLITFCVFYCST